MYLQEVPAIGFEWNEYKYDGKEVLIGLKGRNIVKILEYFPIIGMIIGIARMLKELSNFPEGNIRLFLRGAVSATNLGVLHFIPDVLATLIRGGIV